MLVSIFIPTYNSSKTIARTLDCILSQTYKDIEICLVDDCSTDNTMEILSDYASKYSCIKVLKKEKNGGFVPDSWNRVFPLISGEFTFYMSHDDMLSSDCIEKLVKTQQKTDADCIIPNVIFCYDKFTENISKQNESIIVYSARSAFAKMLNYDIPGFALWRTSLIRKIGMPTEAFNSDEGMQRIWALNSNKVVVDQSAKFYYLIISNSITKGLKPYHYSGLKTQQRLLKAIAKSGLFIRFPKEVIRFAWQYFKSYIYLTRKLKNAK